MKMKIILKVLYRLVGLILVFLCGLLLYRGYRDRSQHSYRNQTTVDEIQYSKPLLQPNNRGTIEVKEYPNVRPQKVQIKHALEEKEKKSNATISNSNGYTTIKPRNTEVTNARIKRVPGAINIGIQKCGTGALRSYLKIHPSIIPSKIQEVHFFDIYINHSRPFDEEIKRYLKHFPTAFLNETVYENTPEYFDRVDPYDLYRMNPALRLILMVCEPVRRTISAYAHQRSKKRYTKKYEDYVFDKYGNINISENIIVRSKYDKPLERYLKYFPRNQFLVIEHEFLLKQPTLAMQKVEKFLGLKKFYTNETFYFNEAIGYYCVNNSIVPFNRGCLGRNKRRHHPNVSEEQIL